MEAIKVQEAPNTAPLNVAFIHLTCEQNERMIHLFRTAYCIVKQNFSVRSFPVLLTVQDLNGVDIGVAYQNRMAGSTFISSIAKVQLQSTVEIVNE